MRLSEDKDWFYETEHELQLLVQRLDTLAEDQFSLHERVARLEANFEAHLDTEPLPWGDLD